MKYWILTCLLFTGCASKGIVATIFLKETGRRFANLEGDACQQSGFEVVKDDEKHYTLITYYSNCFIHEYRQLEEFEIKQWKPNK